MPMTTMVMRTWGTWFGCHTESQQRAYERRIITGN